MAEYLKPKGMDTANLDRRRMEDGQFRNPPTYMQLGGFSSAAKAMLDKSSRNLSLERGGPQTVRGRPI